MRRVACPHCRAIRLVSEFGRCQGCGVVIAAEARRGWWRVRARFWATRLLPPLAVLAFAVFGVRAGWRMGQDLSGSGNLAAVSGAAVLVMWLLTIMNGRERDLRLGR